MKNLAALLISLAIISLNACSKTKPPHYYLTPAIKENFFYKVGSYWIYKDSITGEVDSFYVKSSVLSTESNGGDLVDRIDMDIVSNTSTYYDFFIITITDSVFQINFFNNKDITANRMNNINLFTYPFKLNSGYDSEYGTGEIIDILSNLSLNGNTYSKTAISFQKNGTYFQQLYNSYYSDYYYINSSAGIIKIVFHHSQDSVHRVLELQRSFIIKQ